MFILKKTFKKLTPILISFILALGLSFALQSILAAWAPPTADPPSGNVPPPINEGVTTQTKLGGLGILGNFSVGIYVPWVSKNTLNVDVSSGEVGVGFGDPQTELHIFPSDNSTQPYIYIERHDNTDQMGLQFREAGALIWSEYVGTPGFGDKDLIFDNGSERVRFKADGSVGIGVDPQQQLEITKNFRLPASTASTGNIYKAGDRFIHNYGTKNLFMGVEAGNFSLTGDANIGFGPQALFNLTSGTNNIAVGSGALFANTTGYANLAIGSSALRWNVGSNNTALGYASLYSNVDSEDNTAIGRAALYYNTAGRRNVAIGSVAGPYNSSGDSSVFIGYEAGWYEKGSNKLYIANSKDNTLIYGDFSATKIGMGTTSPNKLLHLYKDSGENAELDIQSVAGANNHWGIYQDRATKELRFWNNAPVSNKDILKIKDTGDVVVAGNVCTVSGNCLNSVVGWTEITSDTNNFQVNCEHKMLFTDGTYNGTYFYPTIIGSSYIKVFDVVAGSGLLTIDSFDKTDISAGSMAGTPIKTYRKCQ